MSTPQNPFEKQPTGEGSIEGRPTVGQQPPAAPQQPVAPQQYGAAPAQPYGAQQGYAPAPAAGAKSKLVAGILGILLGAFGVHNFYLGYTGKAIAQLLITVLSLGFLSFISAIWGLIEGVLILVSKPGTDWHKDASGAELQD
ncbi:MAG: TM2 domain-containing protein [Gordonia sp. (in: high G+C Gram-positive bacteria)]